jgi:hypothetical protein
MKDDEKIVNAQLQCDLARDPAIQVIWTNLVPWGRWGGFRRGFATGTAMAPDSEIRPIELMCPDDRNILSSSWDLDRKRSSTTHLLWRRQKGSNSTI